jgi:hypothetical protein
MKANQSATMSSSIMRPYEHPLPAFRKTSTLGMLFLSALCVGSAPFVVPEGYSWLTLSVSESAAQGLQGAWLARCGFLLFGIAVIRIAMSLRTAWPRGSYWAHMAFGVCMLGTAAFSHMPWISSVPVDMTEDLLHSATASFMGFGFTMGVALRLFHKRAHHVSGTAFDLLAVAFAIAVPSATSSTDAPVGLIQRLMFCVGYLWYGMESLKQKQ